MNSEKIGLFIKEKRLDKKMTQKDLAKKLHVTDRAVSKWERGKGIPDISLLEDLSKILDISIIEILKGEYLEDKDDKNIKDTILYAEKHTSEKVEKAVIGICWCLLVFISILFIYNNLRVYIIMNIKTSITDPYIVNNENVRINRFDEIEKSIISIEDNCKIIIDNKDKISEENREEIVSLCKTMPKDYKDTFEFLKEEVSMSELLIFTQDKNYIGVLPILNELRIYVPDYNVLDMNTNFFHSAFYSNANRFYVSYDKYFLDDYLYHFESVSKLVEDILSSLVEKGGLNEN